MQSMGTDAHGGGAVVVNGPDRPGALVISLDFELHWGMRDHTGADSLEFADLVPSRRTVTDLASVFNDRRIRATWATVGCLFASSAAELGAHLPVARPSYRNTAFDPYLQVVGHDEAADPEHLAGSLVDQVASTPGQEIASHTFSHFYCLEDGQTEEQFRADLGAAQSIAAARGLHLTSLVLPRNQWNPRYAAAVADNGFTSFRGPQPSLGHRARANGDHRAVDRAARLLDSYVGSAPPPTFSWDDRLGPHGLCDIPASAFLRPYTPQRRRLDPLRLRRLTAGMRHAARHGRIFHLWWHPHNFTRYPTESFDFLGRLLDEFDGLAESEGMRSLSMHDVASSIRVDHSTDSPAGP